MTAMNTRSTEELAAELRALPVEQLAALVDMVGGLEAAPAPQPEEPEHDVYRRLVYRTTHPKRDGDRRGLPDDALNLRKAWGVFGALVMDGRIEVDMRAERWDLDVDIAVSLIARTLSDFE